MVDRSQLPPIQEDDVLDPQAMTELDIREQLARVLSSASFRQADRLRDFLSFSVEETLAGRTSTISAPTVAVEVFGNGRDLDQKSESLVRVQARQLRLKLNQYYDTEGWDDPLRIDMPAGGYVSTFRRLKALPQASGQVFNVQAIQRLPVAIEEFEYVGEDLSLHAALETLRDAVADALGTFDFLSVSSRPFRQADIGSGAVHPTSMVLSGSVIEQGDSRRLNIVLQAVSGDRRLWSRQYDLNGIEGDWIPGVAKHLAVNVAGSSGPIIRYALEQTHFSPELTDPALQAYLEVLRHMRAPTHEENTRLREKLEHLIEANPGHALLTALQARVLCEAETFFRNGATEPAELERALEMAQTAVALDPSSAFAWRVLATNRYETRQIERAHAAADSTLELNPNDTDAMALIGSIRWESGDFATGLQLVQKAIDLNDHPPTWYRIVLVHEKIRCGAFEDAFNELVQVEMGPFFWVFFLEAVVFGHLGRRGEFRRSYDRLGAEAKHILVALKVGSDDLHFPDEFVQNCKDGLSKGCRDLGLDDWTESIEANDAED